MDLDDRLSPQDRAAIQQALIRHMQDDKVPIPVRAEAGRVLSEIGDPRRGVGAHPYGVPDIDWIEIPPGDFVYGDDAFDDAERPERTETTPAFWISRYLVTVRQFQSFISAGDGYVEPGWWDGLGGLALGQRIVGREAQSNYSNHPHDNVSWYDAVAFCRWLSSRLHLDIRLPTEVEWEKAARGPVGLVYPWGDEFDPARCNSIEGETIIGRASTVGLYPKGASPFGAMDMAGNVWEWCLNTLEYDLDVSLDADRVLRGGSWYGNARRCRSVTRHRSRPEYRDDIVGFRLIARLKG